MTKAYKRIFAVVLVFALAFALSACKGKNKTEQTAEQTTEQTTLETTTEQTTEATVPNYLGEWEMTSGKASGITVPTASIGTMTFNFKADGKCDFNYNMAGKQTSITVTWKETEKGVSVKDGTDTFELVANGDTLELDRDGTVLIFTRKK